MSVIQNKLRLNKLEFSTGNGKISISPPASASYSLQLPNVSGNNLQILSTDSTGILSWVNQNCPVIPTTMSTFLVNPTSSNLRATIIGVSGTGYLVFSEAPTLSNITTDTIKLDSITAASSTISINGSINQTGSINSTSFIKTGGTSNQFLMADGSTVISDINPTFQNVYDNSSTGDAFNVIMSPEKNINFTNDAGNIVLSILNNTDYGIHSNSAVINSISASSIITSQILFNADNQVVNKKYIDDKVGAICITAAVNTGAETLISTNVNPAFVLKSLKPGPNINLASDANAITISAQLPASTTITNSGTPNSASILNPTGISPNYLTKGLKVGGGLTIDGTVDTDITLATKGINQEMNNIYSSNTQLPAASRTYYHQLWAQSDGSISDICLWISSYSLIIPNNIIVGIYKGTLAPTLSTTLVAYSNSFSSASFERGRIKLPLVNIVSGQNLSVYKDQALILVYSVSGSATRLYATTGFANTSMSYYISGYSNPPPSSVPVAGTSITQKGVFTINYA
jgi:hypothetical protein